MFYSERHKLLVIGIPKTGTVSVEKALMNQLDSDGICHGIHIRDKVYRAEWFKQGMINHARAREFKEILGGEYEKLVTIAFLRNPYSKLVSIYFFTKSLKLFAIPKGKKKVSSRALRYTLSVLLARVLPFRFWMNFYPYRSSTSYIRDYDGKLIVDYIGRTENMEEDLNKFLKKELIINEDRCITLSRANQSRHRHWSDYYKNPSIRSKATVKMKQDIEEYEAFFESISFD